MSEGDGTHSVSDLGYHKGVCDVQIFVAHPVFLRGNCPGKPSSIIFPSVFTTCNATNIHCRTFTRKVDLSSCSWQQHIKVSCHKFLISYWTVSRKIPRLFSNSKTYCRITNRPLFGHVNHGHVLTHLVFYDL
jgi:hypothetical protein